MNHQRPFERALRHILSIGLCLLALCWAPLVRANNPCTATALTVGATCSNVAASLSGATTSTAPNPSCGISTGPDVWFSVVVPASGSVRITTTAGGGGSGLQDAAMSIYTGCTAPFTQVACDLGNNMPSITLTCQVPTTTLYIRVWKENGGAARVNFSICAMDPGLSPTTNDDPCTATPLSVGASCSNTQSTNVCATASSGIAAPGCANYNGGDVWFSIPVPASGSLTVTTSTVGGSAFTNGGLAIYSATNCSTPGSFALLGCNDGSNMGALTLTCLTAGSTVYARVWSNNNAQAGAFNICAVNPNLVATTNDDPCTAIPLSVGASCSNTQSTNVCATASSGIMAPGCANYTSGDVWFSITVPASGSLTVTTSTVGGSAFTNGGLAIYSATNCSTPGSFALLGCNDNGTGMGVLTMTCLTAGTTVYARVWSNNNAQAGTFNICAVNPNLPPTTNDDPCTATALSVGASCSTTQSTNVCATASSGIAAPGCANYNGGDVWFSITVPASGSLTVTTSTVGGSAFTNGGLAIYSATNCSTPASFAVLGCNDNGNNMGALTLTCLTAGSTVYARVWANNNAQLGVFNICAVNPGLTPATNDDPCSATTLTVNASCSNTLASNYCATASAGFVAPACSDYNGGDVWFKFVAPASGLVTITTSTASGSALDDTGLSLYSATNCSTPYSFIELGCADDISFSNAMSSLSVGCLTSGSTYYIRVWEYDNDVVGTFNICVTSGSFTGTPPSNDEPCGATALAVGTTCSATASTNANARPSCGPPAPGCGWSSTASRDVWFSFVAPTSGIAVIEATANSLTDGNMALYTAASCSGPFTMLACDDNDGSGSMPMVASTSLTPGDTYYIRFWGAAGGSGTFNICVRAPAMPATTCAYALEMFDSNENGWGNSRVETSVNGAAYTNTTLASGGYNVVLFGVNTGQTFDLRYNVNGSGGQDQIRYCLRLVPGGQPLFQSGPTPSPTTPTIAFHTTADCSPPVSSGQECNGGSTVCGSSGISNGIVGFGLSQDLDVANRGCLAQGERQGTWYMFSPSAGGTFGFTITPAGHTDYDFALWGPYNNVMCPPNNAPIRCSYAAPSGGSYVTGCGNGANDQSEGGGGDGWVSPFNAQANDVFVLYIDNYETNGQQFSLAWSISAGSSLDCTVLPVEFLFIDAEANGADVNVTWATATEQNSDHFIVERSADNSTFTPIGRVDAAGDSQQRIDYAFVDEAPLTGANYYRLLQVDRDGASKYSATAVALSGVRKDRPVLFPNPATDVLHVALEVERDGDYIWQVLDPSGRVQLSVAAALKNGERTLDLPLQQLAAGSYALRALTPQGDVLPAGAFIKQ